MRTFSYNLQPIAIMGAEAINYLNKQEQHAVGVWAEGIVPFLEKYPRLQEVDLVVEGGVGTGVTMAHMARFLFPNAFYVGTDIAERLVSTPRQSHSVDERALQRMQAANNFPSLGMSGATILANCLDKQLIEDIAAKTDKHTPILVSYNALNALTDRKMNPWDKKYESDIFSITQLASMESPYVAQIHTGVGWEEDGEPRGDKLSCVRTCSTKKRLDN